MNTWFGYNVFQVMNITDVDDKIINKSKELKVDFKEITQKYTATFFRDMQALNIQTPHSLT